VRALTIVEPGVLELGEVEDPTPGADEVVVEVGACGVCGTDLHLIDGESPLASYPLVPGHEFSGVVVARETLSKDQPWGSGSRSTPTPTVALAASAAQAERTCAPATARSV